MTFYAMEVLEGTVNGTKVVTFTEMSGSITLTNDSDNDLLFKLTDDFATLKAKETFSMDFSGMSVTLQGTNIPYRIWCFA